MEIALLAPLWWKHLEEGLDICKRAGLLLARKPSTFLDSWRIAAVVTGFRHTSTLPALRMGSRQSFPGSVATLGMWKLLMAATRKGMVDCDLPRLRRTELSKPSGS